MREKRIVETYYGWPSYYSFSIPSIRLESLSISIPFLTRIYRTNTNTINLITTIIVAPHPPLSPEGRVRGLIFKKTKCLCVSITQSIGGCKICLRKKNGGDYTVEIVWNGNRRMEAV
jgi:hypothetical protein